MSASEATLPVAASPGCGPGPGPGRAGPPWGFLGALCVAFLALSYGGLIASTAVYLGLGDSLHFLAQERLWSRVWLTLWTAGVSTLLAMALAVPAGYALSRHPLPLPELWATLVDLPVMVPPAAVGAFLLGAVDVPPVRALCDLLGLHFSHRTEGVLLCQVTVTLAFGVRLSKLAFDAVPARQELLARTLGASSVETLWRVTLPQAGRGLGAAALVVFARAAAEWEALMLFVGATQGRTDTLPFAVYLDWNGGLMGWVASMSLICVLLALALMGAARLGLEADRGGHRG